MADSLLNTDLAAVSGPAGAEAATREPTRDVRDRQRSSRTRRASEKNKTREVPVEEQTSSESPGHEIDSFA